jgi:FAD/FMN-containing dehydrogenase
MGSIDRGGDLLANLATAIPDLPVVLPSSREYTSLRETYVHTKAEPLAIVRPRTAEDVAAIIPIAHSHSIKISVRSGGHDLFGRSVVNGSLVIDMRPLKSVEVSEDCKTAKVGGGILMGGVAEALARFGLVTPFGSVPSVGYVGWATLGGYGVLSGKYGLGVDQIVGAKVVNWKGELVDADAEMLKGIRGAGGNFGVIVELTIKVYPLKSVSTYPKDQKDRNTEEC